MAKQIQLPIEYPIPCNWKWVEIGKLVFIRSGYPFDSKRFSSESEGRKPLIRIRNVVRGETDTFTDEDCPAEYTIHYGDVLIGMDGDFNVAKWKSEDGLLNQRVCYICSSSDALLNDYLFYYLPEPLKKINDVTPSVTVKHLSTKTIEKTSIPLPPLAEQQRIVDRIESLFAKLDEAKEKAQTVVDGFEDRRTAILHKAFTGELTEEQRKKRGVGLNSWEPVTLKDIVSGFKYGTSEKSDYLFTGMPVLRIPNIGDGGIDFIDIKNLSSETVEAANQIHENDILIIRSNGSRDLVGKCALVPQLDQEYAYASFLIRIKPSERVRAEYLVLFLNSADARAQMFAKAKSSAGINNINSKELGAILLKLPELWEQEEITRQVSKLLLVEKQAKEAAEQVIDQIDAMKKSILARAFRGELGTNDPADESAEELLKRIL